MKFSQLLRAASGAFALFVLLALAGPSSADVVIFKDGFTLFGKVKREGQEYEQHQDDGSRTQKWDELHVGHSLSG